MSSTYTPGHSPTSVNFMAMRSLESHGAFFQEALSGGRRLLDVGCGPGTITLGLAQTLSSGEVVGVDFAESQVEEAQRRAFDLGLENLRFLKASGDDLPFPDASFDRVFSHALFEHLPEPEKAAAEIFRVLRPGGIAGICSPDWGGFVLAPPSIELTAAIQTYQDLQKAKGGDVLAGRKLGSWLAHAGFTQVQMSARYECYASLLSIGNYLAEQLEAAGKGEDAQVLRQWSQQDGGMFAQSWVSAIGRKPS